MKWSETSWFEKECDALEKQRFEKIITEEEYKREMRQLRKDAQEEDRQSIIDAGRGNLIR